MDSSVKVTDKINGASRRYRVRRPRSLVERAFASDESECSRDQKTVKNKLQIGKEYVRTLTGRPGMSAVYLGRARWLVSRAGKCVMLTSLAATGYVVDTLRRLR